MASKGAEGIDVSALFSTPADVSMGDIALPCFKFAAALKKSPVNIAEELAALFSADGVIAKAEAVMSDAFFYLGGDQS